MTPVNMIQDLAQVLDEMFRKSHFRLKNRDGEFVYPTIYRHAFPAKSKEDVLRYPYLLVYIHNGEQASENDPTLITVHFICGVFDDSSDMQGFADAMNMLEKVRQCLYGEQQVARFYDVIYPYSFAVLEDVRYPYFQAGLAVTVELPGLVEKKEGYRYD